MDPFRDLPTYQMRQGEPPVCPSCRGTSVTFLGYCDSLSRALMRCDCGAVFLLLVCPPSKDVRPLVRLLVVEPDADTRQLYSEELRKAEFAVASAATAFDAIEMTSGWRPSLITTELRLPDLDGLELCQQLKRHSDGAATIRIIVVTDDTRRGRLDEVKRVADAVVTKPCSPKVIVAEARRLAARRR